jgi:hypothetical protein
MGIGWRQPLGCPFGAIRRGYLTLGKPCPSGGGLPKAVMGCPFGTKPGTAASPTSGPLGAPASLPAPGPCGLRQLADALVRMDPVHRGIDTSGRKQNVTCRVGAAQRNPPPPGTSNILPTSRNSYPRPSASSSDPNSQPGTLPNWSRHFAPRGPIPAQGFVYYANSRRKPVPRIPPHLFQIGPGLVCADLAIEQTCGTC